eukprot:297066-Prymnesium_polylepis.1
MRLSTLPLVSVHSDIRVQSLGPLYTQPVPDGSPGRSKCFCHEVNESPPCSGDHVTSPISSDAGTSQRGITAHNLF